MELEQMALLIPILGIVLGVAVAIVAIVASHREKVSRAELRHRERIAAMEKGLELPLEPAEPETDRKIGSLRSGVMGVLIGVLLYFAIREVADAEVALFGLIPAAVGIANLVSYFVEAKKKYGNGK
jgi:cadmium resistance protein CadD (predicted permease)